MKNRDFLSVAMVIFLIVGVVHLYRAFNDISVMFGQNELPMWGSWAAAAIALYMAYSAYKLKS